MTIGRERDRYEGILHKPRIDYLLLISFVVLILWYIVFVAFLV